MNRSKVPYYLILGVLLAVGIGNAQTIKQVPAKPTVAVDGKSLYHEYCAVCHGENGKGGGPAAAALKVAPSDLTQIARKNGGKFDDERMLKVIQGESPVAAHGSKDMPMWGAIFNNMGTSASLKQTRIHSLLQYLEGLQAK